jgi:hypothetical protein
MINIKVTPEEADRFVNALSKGVAAHLTRMVKGETHLSREEEILGAILREDPFKGLYMFWLVTNTKGGGFVFKESNN